MELTNLLFAFLIGFVITQGFMVFFVGVAVSYPTMTASSGYLSNLSSQMNVTAQYMDVQTINQATNQSLNTQNLNVAAIFGYVTGAINALSTVAKAPYIFLQMINGVNASIGFPLIPDFVLTAVVVAVYLITLIGILFYLLKVK